MNICHEIQNDVIHLHRNNKWRALCGLMILGFFKCPDEERPLIRHINLIKDRMQQRPDKKKLCEDCIAVAKMIRDLEKQNATKEFITSFMLEIEGIK